jgi:RNA polymerase sigma factor (sigma-70 family)
VIALAQPEPPSLDLPSLDLPSLDLVSIALMLAGQVTVIVTDPDDPPDPLEHMGLVKWIALAYCESGRRCGLDLDDLIQSGCVGLMIACKRFNRDRGYKFSTYAIRWIRLAIRRAIQNGHRPLRVPIPLLDLMDEVRREKVKESDLTAGKRAWIGDARRALGLATVGDPDVLAHLVADRHRDDGRDDDAEFARELLALLPACERGVIAAHFGVGDDGPLPLAAVGSRLGLPPGRTQALYRRGMDRIRTRVRATSPRRDPCGAKSPCSDIEGYADRPRPAGRTR